MRMFRLLYPALVAALVFACLGSALSAEQGDALNRFVKHFGKVVILPNNQRVVFYAAMNEVWGLSKDNRITERGYVETEPRPDWRLDLHWRNGVVDTLDTSNAEDLRLVDETPPIINQLEQFVGKRLPWAVGPLSEGAQFLQGGVVLDGADEVIGEWEVRTNGIIGFYPPKRPRVDLDPSDLIDAPRTMVTHKSFQPRQGPEQALGVLIWSPGAGDNGQHPRADTGDVPYILDWLYNDGWDVVYMHRHGPRLFEDRPRHAAAIRQAAADLRADGYKRVIVAGQSSGGTYSMLAADESLNAYGLLLMASGPSTGPLPFRDALDAATAARVAVIHFREDTTIRQRNAMTVAQLLARKPHSLNIFEPPGMAGHSAGFRSDFSNRFGDCLMQFFDPARTPTGQECDRH